MTKDTEQINNVWVSGDIAKMTANAELIKEAWVSGDRVTAFTLYIIDCCPGTFIRYVGAVPNLEPMLDALDNIEGFKEVFRNLLKQVKSGQVTVTRLPWRGHSDQLDDPPLFLYRSAIAA